MTAAQETITSRPETPSIDADEVAKFEAMAADWWDPTGKFKPLHKFNPTRLAFIRDTVIGHFSLDAQAKRPLEGISLLDIGCGGGLVSEPMTRLGAQVTGIDAAEANIKTALTHARQSGLDIDYRAGTAEGLLDAGEGPFDVVLNLEVVEHVANADQFLRDTASLVAPGGIMVVATINRTPKAWALAIFGAEYVMRWLPRGTHEFDKLVKPREVEDALNAAGLHPDAPTGVSFNPLMDRWSISKDTQVNYMVVGRRPKD